MSFREWWDENIYDPLYNVANTIGEGIQNWWYKNTGQAHLTPEYQHEEELANTAYQRAAQDMTMAGLSKFGGVNPASSPTPKSGSGLLSTALAASQLKGSILSNKENSWNLKKAKQWGVPTSAVGDFAKFDAISKFLFGKGVHDLVGEDGVMGLIRGILPGGSSGSPDSAPSDPVTGAAAADATQAVLSDMPESLFVPVYQDPLGFTSSQVYKPAPINLPKYISTDSKDPLKFETFSSTNFEEPSARQSVVQAAGGSDLSKEIDKWMRQTLNDDKMDTAHVEALARQMSKLHGISFDSALHECYNWITENLSNVEWIYHFE